MNGIVERVKLDLDLAGLTHQCPNCGSTELHAVFTTIKKCDMVADTSTVVSTDGILLDVYCEGKDCGWHIEGDDYSEKEKEG